MSKNIYLLGVFDLFHVGHLNIIKNSKKIGDKLIVGINSDRVVTSYKRKPIINEKERMEIIKSCKFVDDCFIVDTFDNKEILLENNINIIVHGNDWVGKSYLDQIRVSDEFISKNKIKLKFLPYYEGTSTSKIIEKITTSFNKKI